MKTAVRYYSRSGNTEKVARAIADAVGTKAETIEQPIESDTDILFLGGATYGGKADPKIRQFIASLDPQKVKQVVAFGTANFSCRSCREIRNLVAARGIAASETTFHCVGSMGCIRKSRPNAADLEKAKTFAEHFLF